MSNNNPVNNMTTPVIGLINDLVKVMKTKGSQSLLVWIAKVDINFSNKTNKSWQVVYVIEKVRQLFSKHSQ